MSVIVANRYELLTQLGEGGMGVVYKAYDRLNRQMVALKQVRRAPSDKTDTGSGADSTDSLALAMEFRVLASLRHPNVIGVLDYGFDSQRQAFYTMQFLEDLQTLDDAVKGRDLADKVRLLNESLLALSYLHRRGVIHRDLKPGNIGVTADNVVKVMDFGLARSGEQTVKEVSFEGISGTFHYLAPELFAEAPASIQSDLYAMGIVFYKVFVGNHPFNINSLAALIYETLNKAPKTEMLSVPLAAVINRLLAKDPKDRYRTAAEVITDLCAATDQPLPVESDLLRESFLQASTFVGRSEELARLNAALQEARHGRGSSWLIGGESGVGKSRLLDEISTRALIRGTVVLRGQATADGGLPYQLWREVLRRMVLFTNLSDLEASILKTLIPDIEVLLGRLTPLPELPPLDSNASAQRLLLTVVELFKRQTEPLVLILEDLHWAADDLLPLVQLNRVVQESPWLIIGSYRDDEAPTLPSQFPDMKVMRLSRFSQETVSELATAMLGEAGEQPRLVELLQQETEGNAYFMVEVVRALAARAGSLRDVGEMTLPRRVLAGGVQGVLRSRLDRIPAWGQDALHLAAVIGRQLDMDALKSAIPNLNWEDWLTQGVNAPVLEAADGKWRFAHDKLRETLLNDLPDEERSQLYRRAAEAIEQAHPDDVRYAETLADYWRVGNEPEKMLGYISKAVLQLINISAEYSRAYQLLINALPLTEATTLARYRSELLSLLSETLRLLNRSDEAKEYAERVLTDETAALPVRGRALLTLGTLSINWGRYDDAVRYGEQLTTLSAGGDYPDGALNGLNVIATTIFYRGDYPTATERCEEYLRLSIERGDLRRIAAGYHNLGNLASIRGDYEEGRRLYEQALKIRQEIGEVSTICLTWMMLGLASKNEGHYEDYERCAIEALGIASRIGDQRLIGQALAHRGNSLFFQKKYDDGREYLSKAITISRELKDLRIHAANLVDLGTLEDVTGNFAAARRYDEEALEIDESIGNRPGIANVMQQLGDIAFWEGDHALAESYYVRVLTLNRELDSSFSIAYCLGCSMAWLAITRDELVKAHDLIAEALSLALPLGNQRLLYDIAMQQARLFAKNGETTRAAELAVVIEAESNVTFYTLSRWLPPLMGELESVLGKETLASMRSNVDTLNMRDLLANVYP